MTGTGRLERTSDPARVLVVLDQVRPVGLVRQLLEVLHRVGERGFAPHVACVARVGADVGPLLEALEARGLDHTLIRERRAFDPRPLFTLRRLASALRPAILQTHGYKSSIYAVMLRRRPMRWIAFYHGRTSTDWKVRAYHALERRAMGRATAIATVAEGVEAHFRRQDRGRIAVIPNGVLDLPPPAHDSGTVRRAHGLPIEATVLGFVGRLSSEKGPDLFLEVFARLRREDPGLRSLVVGDGPDREDLVRLAAQFGIAADVRFAGRVDDVAELYGAMDLLLITSRSEVFPNVLLEAVDAGLPVAASPVGGLPAVARGLPTVALASEVSVESLAAAGREALARVDDPCLAETRSIIRQRYSQERRAELLVSLYRRVLEALP